MWSQFIYRCLHNTYWKIGAFFFVAVLWFLACALDCPGQETTRFTLRALHTSEPIKIDGRLDEPAWNQAEAVSGFRQKEPYEGSAATERTEVRVLFDDHSVYFGIRAYDSDAANINARELSRDADFSNDDKIGILLDTFHDHRNAYRFVVNPLGTQQDALVTDDGRAVNLSWDALWFSAATRDGEGYTVEIEIPLSTLRFRDGAPRWGFNVVRGIRRKNEETLLSGWQRTFGLERVSQAGELIGLEELHRHRLIEIKPYVSGGGRQNGPQVGHTNLSNGFFGKAGLEVARIGITPSLTAEFTANPDFGQAEVDNQIINLSRFSVFLPEHREFFLENAGVFLFGREEINQLFFTRSIGLTAHGEPVPIDYGAKITGRIGSYTVGLLQVQTRQITNEAGQVTVPRQEFTVARVKRDLFDNSYIGGIFLNRQGGTATAYNRGAGVDGQFQINEYWRVSGFLAATATPNARSGTQTGRVTSNFENNTFRLIGLFEHIGKNYNPELGFTERTGVRQYFGQGAYKLRSKKLRGVREMEFETQLEYYEDRNTRPGRLSTRQTELSWNTTFNNSATVFFRPVEDHTDVLTEAIEIRPGIVIPKGAYRFNRPILAFNTDQSKKIILSGTYQFGDFYSGKRDEISAGVTLRPNSHFLAELNDTYNRVDLPQGKFSTNLFGGKVVYNFSRNLLTTAFVQLNSAAQLTSVNVRLRYIYRPNSDFFVIYNQNTGRGLERASYQFQVKLAYYWRK